MIIAEKYGRSPEEVENWEPYWLNRAILKLEGEGARERRKVGRKNKTRRMT